MRIAGVMSGTSLDGIDVAILDLRGPNVATVGYSTIPYTEEFRERILNASSAQEISRLNFELGALYAGAVRKACARASVPVSSLDLVGCHGQTIYHEGGGPHPNTLQIGESSVIAESLGVPVVSDFRPRDIAAGGQGAPLVPLVDFLLFASADVHRVAVNLGGIANITVLAKDGPPERIVAFDTGPGNMVIDQLIRRMTGGKEHFDRNGEVAARGRIHRPLLAELLQDDYYSRKPPRSAGREEFGTKFVDRMVSTGAAWEDLVATATALTAATLAQSVSRYAPKTEELIVAGGGVHNSQLMGQIAALLPRCRVLTTADFGIDPDAREAIAFAILARQTWRHRAGNLPSATGARHPVVLGKITWGPPLTK